MSIGMVVGLSLGGATMAFGHGGDADLIHGCQNAVTGQLRLIGPDEECRNKETAVDWNKEGIRGDPGADGADGAAGADGAPCLVADNGDDTFTMTCADSLVTWSGVPAPVDCSLIEPFADLAGCDLSGLELIGVDLTGANLTGANLSGTDLDDTNLSGATLTLANLVNADVQDADLTGANLFAADLTSATLEGSDLTGANLFAAELFNVFWGDTICPDGTNTDFNGDGNCDGVHRTP